MHRATALAMMKEGELVGDARPSKPFHSAKSRRSGVVIALAEYNGELPLLGKG